MQADFDPPARIPTTDPGSARTHPLFIAPDSDEMALYGALIATASKFPVQGRYPLWFFASRIVPSLGLKQFIATVDRAGDAAFVNWALLDEDAFARTQNDERYLWEPDDWHAGAHPWIAEIMESHGDALSLLRGVREALSTSAVLYWRVPSKKEPSRTDVRAVRLPPADIVAARKSPRALKPGVHLSPEMNDTVLPYLKELGQAAWLMQFDERTARLSVSDAYLLISSSLHAGSARMDYTDGIPSRWEGVAPTRIYRNAAGNLLAQQYQIVAELVRPCDTGAI